MPKVVYLATTVSILAAALHAEPAQAQTPDQNIGAGQEGTADQPTSSSEPEIVVTGARLRQETVQDTPLSVTSLSAADVQQLNSPDILGLTAVAPNLTVSSGGPTGNGLAAISLRGFVTTGNDPSTEPGIAVYVDGVYQVITAGSLADLGDVERVEVLRGPQGALLGKSTSAGAILLTRSRPRDELSAEGSIEYGSHNLVQAIARIDGPIVPGILAAKLYGSYRHRDDYVTNLSFPGDDLGGEDRAVVRGALLFTPSDNLEVYLTADHFWNRSSQPGGRNISQLGDGICNTLGICLPDGDRINVTDANFTDPPRSNETNVTMQIDYDFGGAKLTSISGYRNYELINNADFDYSPANYLHVFGQTIDLDQYSQEIRLSSRDGGSLSLNDRLAWVVGAYYGSSTADQVQHQQSGATIANPDGTITNQSQRITRENFGLFGSLDLHLTSRLIVTGGVRHSWDEVDHDFSLRVIGPVVDPIPDNNQRADFQNTSFEGGVRYELTPDHMIYFRYAEGYRGGGFVGLPSSLAAAPPYDPETSVNYEIGARTSWLDRRFTFNITAFDTTYNDLQRRVTVAGANGAITLLTTNAAKARTRGVEIESIIRPADQLTIHANLGYLDARYLEYVSETASGPVDLSDRPLIYAPKYTARMSANYRFYLGRGFMGFDTADLLGSIDYRSTFTQIESFDRRFYQPGYATVDGSLRFSGGSRVRYEMQFYVHNLFDTYYAVYRSNAGGLTPYIQDDIGRTFGVLVRARF